MSETDSFIEEVTEEVRRDKLYALYRKYGWIAAAVVVLVVSGAAYNEWRKASEQKAAQALGNSVTAALSGATPEKRNQAISEISTEQPGGQVFVDLLEAATLTETSDRQGALAILDDIAQRPDTLEVYRQLAMLKAVILRGADQDRETRMATLEVLATPGNPFRVIALEQIALAEFEHGNNEAAIEILRGIMEEAEVTQGLLQRAQQLIVAMGGDLANSTSNENN